MTFHFTIYPFKKEIKKVLQCKLHSTKPFLIILCNETTNIFNNLWSLFKRNASRSLLINWTLMWMTRLATVSFACCLDNKVAVRV
jgi:hypothetical protein